MFDELWGLGWLMKATVGIAVGTVVLKFLILTLEIVQDKREMTAILRRHMAADMAKETRTEMLQEQFARYRQIADEFPEVHERLIQVKLCQETDLSWEPLHKGNAELYCLYPDLLLLDAMTLEDEKVDKEFERLWGQISKVFNELLTESSLISSDAAISQLSRQTTKDGFLLQTVVKLHKPENGTLIPEIREDAIKQLQRLTGNWENLYKEIKADIVKSYTELLAAASGKEEDISTCNSTTGEGDQ